jgi:hypothetical protein
VVVWQVAQQMLVMAVLAEQSQVVALQEQFLIQAHLEEYKEALDMHQAQEMLLDKEFQLALDLVKV